MIKKVRIAVDHGNRNILYNEELPESIDNIVYCLVSSMRKKIEPELKQCRYIKTVRGVGYKFEGKKIDIFPE